MSETLKKELEQMVTTIGNKYKSKFKELKNDSFIIPLKKEQEIDREMDREIEQESIKIKAKYEN